MFQIKKHGIILEVSHKDQLVKVVHLQTRLEGQEVLERFAKKEEALAQHFIYTICPEDVYEALVHYFKKRGWAYLESR